MKVVMIINEYLTEQQINENYLLCLALLNFEHQVHVVFLNQAFNRLIANPDTYKQWLSLRLYGAEAFLQVNFDDTRLADETSQHCQVIDQAGFEQLINEVDLLL